MITTNNIQTAAMSSKILANAPKRTKVMHALRSPSVVVLPATPNVKDYSFSTRTPVTVDGMLHHLQTQPHQSLMLPPQNHGKEFLTTPSVVVDGVSCHHGPHTHLPSMPPSVTIGDFPSHHEPNVHLPSVPSPRNLAQEFLAVSSEIMDGMSSLPQPQSQLPSIPPPLNIGQECDAMPSTSFTPANR